MHGTLYMVWWAKTCVHILIIPHWWNTCEDTPPHNPHTPPLATFLMSNIIYFFSRSFCTQSARQRVPLGAIKSLSAVSALSFLSQNKYKISFIRSKNTGIDSVWWAHWVLLGWSKAPWTLSERFSLNWWYCGSSAIETQLSGRKTANRQRSCIPGKWKVSRIKCKLSFYL